MSDFVDPDELPFTTEELFDAARRFLPEDAAHALAEHLTECGPGVISARAERRAGWRAAGIPGANTMFLYPWVYPDELLPALASLSADAERRALTLMEDHWAGLRRATVATAQHAAAERAGIIPSREEILRQVRAAAEASGDSSLLEGGLAVQMPPLPPPTPEMEAAADARVAEDRRHWENEVARFRGASGA